MPFAHLVLERTLALIPVILSLTVHEWAHAWVAARLGDTTAHDQGRLTLNPLAHVDVVGTIALPLLGVPFGWAKPVPVEPTRFRRDVSMARGMLLTAAAGPVSNIVLALLCAALVRLVTGRDFEITEALLRRGLVINVALAAFNLLPIPPLDGSRIVDAYVPFEYRAAWRRIGIAGVVLLVALLAIPMFGAGKAVVEWTIRASDVLTR
jgi:Zn-dependent protease